MCQAIVKPKGAVIYKSTLEAAFRSNPHGAGFGYIDPKDNNVWINRGFTTFDSFWEKFEPCMDRDCLIHFRFATHGDKCVDNTHPFPITKNVIMIHNGVLSGFLPDHNDSRSDTRIFASRLKKWVEGAGGWKKFMTPGTEEMLSEMIGHNKLAFLTDKGFTIINEELGEWADGSWYSAGVPKTYQQHNIRTQSHWEGMADAMMNEDNWQCYPRNEVVKDERTAHILQNHLDQVEKSKKRDLPKISEEEKQKLIDQNYVNWVGKDGLRHRRHYAFMTQAEWEAMEEDQISRRGGPVLTEDPTTGSMVLLEAEDIPFATENEGDIAEELIQYMTLDERNEFRELIKDPSIDHTVRDRILKRLKRGNPRSHFRHPLTDPTFARDGIRLITAGPSIRVLDNRADASTVVDSVEAAMQQHETNKEIIDVTATPVNSEDDHGDD